MKTSLPARHPGWAACYLLSLVLGLSHCQRWSEQADDAGSGALKPAELIIDAKPAIGITILLDHNFLSNASPALKKGVLPGDHHLTVRAMGYYPFDAAITLKPGEILTLPVTLKPRQSIAERRSNQWQRSILESEKALSAAAPESKGHGSGAGGPLLAEPIVLLYSSPGASAPLVDGVSVDPRIMRLVRQRGQIRFANVTLIYRVKEGDELEIILPKEAGSWLVDGSPATDLVAVPREMLLRLEYRNTAREAPFHLLLKRTQLPG